MAPKKIDRLCLQALSETKQRTSEELVDLIHDTSIVDDLLTAEEVRTLFNIDSTVLIEYVRKGLRRYVITATNNPSFILCTFYRLVDIRSFFNKRKEVWDARMQELALRYE